MITPGERAAYLTKAADVLEQDGWCQGGLHWPGEGHCTEGAIMVATGYHYAPDGRFFTSNPGQTLAFYDVLGTLGRFLGNSVSQWNDHSSRTKAEVVEALRDAAAIQRAAVR